MPDSTFDKTGLIQQLIQRANRIPYRNKIELDHFRDQVDQTIQNIFGNESDYRHQLNRIRFIPSSFYSPEKEYEESWQRGIQEIIHFLTNILRTESISPNSHKKWIDPGLSRESLIDLSTTKDGNKEFNLPAQRAGTGFQPIDSNEKASKVESYPLIEIPLTNYYSKDEESPLPTEEPPIQSTARQEYQKEKYAYLESFMSEAAPVFSPLPSHKPNDAQETAQIIFLSGEDDQFGKTIQLSLKKLGLGHKLLVLPTDRSPEEILNR